MAQGIAGVDRAIVGSRGTVERHARDGTWPRGSQRPIEQEWAAEEQWSDMREKGHGPGDRRGR